MAATPSWPPPPALLGYRRCEAVFRSAREEAAPSACFVADRRALSRHCGSARHAAGMGTDRELRSYSPRWMRSTAKLAENVRRRDEFPRRRCWGWTAAGTGPKAGLVKLSLPDMRQKRVVLQAYAAVMSLEFMGRPAAPRRTEVTAVCAPIRGRRGPGAPPPRRSPPATRRRGTRTGRITATPYGRSQREDREGREAPLCFFVVGAPPQGRRAAT